MIPNDSCESRVTPEREIFAVLSLSVSFETIISSMFWCEDTTTNNYHLCLAGSQFHVNNLSSSGAFRPLFREVLYLLMVNASLNVILIFSYRIFQYFVSIQILEVFTINRYKLPMISVLTVTCKIVPVPVQLIPLVEI